MIQNFAELLEIVQHISSKVVAVAAAQDPDVLEVAHMAGQQRLAEFILIGDQNKIEELAHRHNYRLDHCQILHEPDISQAARKSIELLHSRQAHLPMKGLLPTSVFMQAVLDKEKGIRGSHLLSEISIIEKPDREGLLLITDCAINIDPDLSAKKQIIENAVVLAQRIGYQQPHVACITSLETVNPSMQDTLDAAVLSKMAQRGQITGCIVDGPFALDNALSMESAKHKGLDSPIAGNADILLMSDIRMGNVLHKAITYIAKKPLATAIMGARQPVIMTSRSDSPQDKLLSLALACVLCID
ncbi:MAG: bifunctional enoyl-CoA hydratase/phosphate acetyltransferase [Clostridiales bacterium]